MVKLLFQGVVAIAALAVVGTVGMTVAQHGHGGHGHRHDMAQAFEAMDLSPAQQGKLERLHELMMEGGDHGMMMVIHDTLIGQLRDNRLDAIAARSAVDAHLERVRAGAYTITEELVAFGSSLDSGQRQIMLEHVDAMEGSGSR